MPDIPVAGGGGVPYNPDMEASMARLEEDMRELRGTAIRIEAMLSATLPHLATKAEVIGLRGDMIGGLAEKPSKTYMWGILAVLLTAYACGLGALAVLK